MNLTAFIIKTTSHFHKFVATTIYCYIECLPVITVRNKFNAKLSSVSYVKKKEKCWYTSFDHSHKKRKDSLETRTETFILRAYIENQESTLLCHASKYKQTENQDSRTAYGLTFLTFYEIIIFVFSFLRQEMNIPESNCLIIACDLSQKHKGTPLHTASRGSKAGRSYSCFLFC